MPEDALQPLPHKIINDPVFGFIKIPRGLILDIVNHPLVQRLSRIKQLGLTSMVYPAAQHTRFQHSIGAFHLMQQALDTLSQKGTFIFDIEREAVLSAILMHDIGHAPFSHVLESALIKGISHEEISLILMERINHDFLGGLNLALKIFKGEYPKKFLHQLISSQLDMDRLDYLVRDCFFTGVAEGNIGCNRIIKMLDVLDDRLVVNSKGLYTIENYLMSRYLMYWQVYLHKTTIAAEKVLLNALLRAKFLVKNKKQVFSSPALNYFLSNDIDADRFKTDPEAQYYYEMLDDNDIWTSLKVWTKSDDKVLKILSSNIINRTLFKVHVSSNKFSQEEMDNLKDKLLKAFNLSNDEVNYLFSVSSAHKDIYNLEDDRITICFPSKETKDITEVSELISVASHSRQNCKYYLCYQRF